MYTTEFRVNRVITGTDGEVGTETEHENKQLEMMSWTAKECPNQSWKYNLKMLGVFFSGSGMSQNHRITEW